MKARTYYPDRDTIDYSFSEMLDTIITWNDHFDAETRTPHQGRFKDTEMYLFRPAKSNYAPVNLGTTLLYSVLLQNYSAADQTAEIAIALDPIFYLWNPYNRRITVDNFTA